MRSNITFPGFVPAVRSRNGRRPYLMMLSSQGSFDLRQTAVPGERWMPPPSASDVGKSLNKRLESLQRHASSFVHAHSTAFLVTFLLALVVVALWSRYRFVFGDYTYTFGTGDAQLIMLKALLLKEGIVQPNPELAPTPAIFNQPPLIPLLFAGISHAFQIPLRPLPFIIVPLLTTGMLLAFFDLVRRTFSLPTAILSALLLALLPRFSLDSTEPDKAAFVISFAVFALWLIVVSKGRGPLLLLSGFALALSCFSHLTGYAFVLVFMAAYFVIRGVSRESALDWRFLAALVMPALAFIAYAVLSHQFTPASAADPAVQSSGGILPSFAQRSVDTLLALGKQGFVDSAWKVYFDGIRGQLTAPIFYLGIAGLAIAAVTMRRTRNYSMLPVAVWMASVTIFFAIQYPAASHGSRYPSYVTPAFIVLAAFTIVTIVQFAVRRWGITLPTAALSLAVLVAGIVVPLSSYASASNPGFRNIYGGYRDAGASVHEQGLLNDGSHILYLGWPSITLELLDSNIEYQHQIHSFGFGSRDLDAFSRDFIDQNNIRYYIEGRAGNDGFDSAATVLNQLQEHYRLDWLGRFERRPGNFANLYEIKPARLTLGEEARWRLLLDEQSARLEAESLVSNPQLLWRSSGELASWIANGNVSLEPFNSMTGVLVENRASFGGIRQVIDARDLRGEQVLLLAEVRGRGATPAKSSVAALAMEGEPPLSQALVPLTGQTRTLIILAATLPDDIDELRVTIATGAGESGDLAIERLYLLPSSIRELAESQ